MFPSNAYNIRFAGDDDAHALRRLAELDSQRALTGRVLIAEDDGGAVAALSLDEHRAVADPFHHTGAPLSLLRMRANALEAYDRMPSLRERLLAGVRPARPATEVGR
jgi:hypothetical protein